MPADVTIRPAARGAIFDRRGLARFGLMSDRAAGADPAARDGRHGVPSRWRARVTYRVARRVERFAGALYELGVRPGQVVACQLPNWWQTYALQLAATRLQAVLAPITTTKGPRELHRMLHRVGARVCITVDEWEGFGHAAALQAVAQALPELRHRVVIGGITHGEIDFRSAFEQTPWEEHHPVALDDAVDDPDRVAMIIFTSGTSGEPKARCIPRTLYTSASASARCRFGPEDVWFTPHALMHTVGQDAARSAVIAGASVVLLDAWSGQRGFGPG
jgi:cyclohexanecarboxylate-CoA ligase